MFVALGVLLLLLLSGGGSLWLLGHGRWTYGECVYMTLITITTVGFGEMPHMTEVPGVRLAVGIILVVGVGAMTYAQANLTALLVEGTIGQAFRRSRMHKQIAALRGHIVVAGAGATGRHVIEELVATSATFVVIDSNHVKLERMSSELVGGRMLYVHGDATDDHVLQAAGVAWASGVVAALTHDKDNLFVTLSARGINATARIVAKVVDDPAAPKMMRAGATAVVSPTQIGGRRIASELLRPTVNEFFDQMLRDKTKNLRLEEVVVPQRSPFDGVALKDTPIRRETRLLVVAVRDAERSFVYNPEPDMVLKAGATLIVMGEVESVLKLRKLVEEKEIPE